MPHLYGEGVLMASLLRAEGLHVIRDGRSILKDVSLDVGMQDFVTIIGPNGAGKSMLLKCLLGIIQPDQGRVTRRPGLTTGYVPQRLIAEPSMPLSVKRFLTLKTNATAETLARCAEETDITPLLARQLHHLSGGELQRVLLARALIGEPELLVLDEPAQNMDVGGQLAFYKLLERLHHTRTLSVLMVSHDLHLVMASTRQVICLYHHVCCSGEPQAVTRDPEFISLFGNDMARMMAVYHHEHTHTHE